jgi:hypothetical protein
MKKGLFYRGALFTMVLLGASETLADNPFNWGPYERDEQSDQEIEISSLQQPEEDQETQPDNQQEKGE